MNLANKTIKVNGNSFIVTSHVEHNEHNEEVITLARCLPEILERPGTIFDLGYKSEKEINYSNEESYDMINYIDEHAGHEIEIASIDKSGLIQITNAILRGLSLKDGNQYKVSFIEPTSTVNPTVKIDLDFLVESMLLAKEFSKAVSEYKANTRDGYDDIFDQANQANQAEETDETDETDEIEELDIEVNKILGEIFDKIKMRESEQSKNIDINKVFDDIFSKNNFSDDLFKGMETRYGR